MSHRSGQEERAAPTDDGAPEPPPVQLLTLPTRVGCAELDVSLPTAVELDVSPAVGPGLAGVVNLTVGAHTFEIVGLDSAEVQARIDAVRAGTPWLA